MTKTIIIDGGNIHDIPSFYKEINMVFMANEDWKLGESLDAFNDLLYGGFGEINGGEEVCLIWKDFEKNRKDLGLDLTKTYYENKLKSPDVFNIGFVRKKLAELANGAGQTYFDIVLEIIGDHSNIKLIEE